MATRRQWTADIGRSVFLRRETMDDQVWSDTFTGRYHVAPPEMPVPFTVVDCGCNIGLTMAHYRALWPECRIVGYEIDADCVRLARRNAPQAEIHHCGISGGEGIANYDPAVRSDSYKLGAGSMQVRTLGLTEAVTSTVGTADFVKMDIEGAEWDVFATDDWVPFVKHLLVELHGPGGSEALIERALGRLTDLGFNARHHTPHPQAVYAWA